MNNVDRRPCAHRHTHQREVILEELCRLESHPTADELFHLVRRRVPRVSLATIYRNLDVLAEQGLVQRMEVAGQQRRFDGNRDPHVHIRCLGCGAVADVEVEPRETPLEEVQEHTDYRVTGQHTEFVGHCPACQQAAEDAGESRTEVK